MNLNSFFNFERSSWISMLIIGVLAVVLGLFAFLAPHSMMHTFITFVGIFIAVSGLSTLLPRLKKNQPLSVASTLSVVLGVLIALAPEGTTTLLVGILGFIALSVGGLWLLGSLMFRSKNSSPFSLVIPLLILLSGIAIFTNRSAGTVFIMYALGFLFVMLGLALIALTAKTYQLMKGSATSGNLDDSHHSSYTYPLKDIFSDWKNTAAHDQNGSSHGDLFSYGKRIFIFKKGGASPNISADQFQRDPYTSRAPKGADDDIIEVDNLAEKSEKDA